MWFLDGEWDEKTELITNFVFASGRWGTAEAHVLSTAARAMKIKRSWCNGKFAYLLKVMFPNARELCWQYPILKKAPWLLPLMWIVRFVEKLLFERGKFTVQKKKLQTIQQDKIQTLQDAMQYVGLDYHF